MVKFASVTLKASESITIGTARLPKDLGAFNHQDSDFLVTFAIRGADSVGGEFAERLRHDAFLTDPVYAVQFFQLFGLWVDVPKQNFNSRPPSNSNTMLSHAHLFLGSLRKAHW